MEKTKQIIISSAYDPEIFINGTNTNFRVNLQQFSAKKMRLDQFSMTNLMRNFYGLEEDFTL